MEKIVLNKLNSEKMPLHIFKIKEKEIENIYITPNTSNNQQKIISNDINLLRIDKYTWVTNDLKVSVIGTNVLLSGYSESEYGIIDLHIEFKEEGTPTNIPKKIELKKQDYYIYDELLLIPINDDISHVVITESSYNHTASIDPGIVSVLDISLMEEKDYYLQVKKIENNWNIIKIEMIYKEEPQPVPIQNETVISEDVEILDSGAKQNKIERTYSHLFIPMMKSISKTRKDGIHKYGEFNHLRIDPRENIDRAINHLYEYLDDVTREDENHLSHAIVRIGMAMDFIEKFGYTKYDNVKDKVEKYIKYKEKV